MKSKERPKDLQTKIFLDGGDPDETRRLLDRMGFLDGQTTNPSLIAKNPEAKKRMDAGEKFSSEELWDFYRQVVTEIEDAIPEGSISIEVFADADTTAERMLEQARMCQQWITNAQIKFPTTAAGLAAAHDLVAAGGRVNMTLCFTQSQAAAVYAATRGAQRGQVYVSPFIGRLDDRGENGMDLIANCMKMFADSDHHVEVLAASARTYKHFLASLAYRADSITAPFDLISQWVDDGMPVPGSDFCYPAGDLTEIPYADLTLDAHWSDYDIYHPLTDSGMEKFSNDWCALVDGECR